MKQLFTLLFICCLFSLSTAQMEIVNYNLEVEKVTYNELEGAHMLSDGVTPVTPTSFYFGITGFEFRIFNQEADTILIDPRTLFIDNRDWLVSAFLTELTDLGVLEGKNLSEVSYLIEGEEGKRIFKAQWKNMGLNLEYEIDDKMTYYANFQVWLHEEDYSIEMRYGEMNIEDPSIAYGWTTGPQVMVGSIFGPMIKLKGRTEDPSMIMNQHVPLIGTPSDGRLYRFTPIWANTTGTDEVNGQFAAYPNPVQDELTLESETEATYQLVDMMGQMVMEGQLQAGKNQLDCSQLAAGVYSLNMNTNGKITSLKVMK